jgi:hypothetical protein
MRCQKLATIALIFVVGISILSCSHESNSGSGSSASASKGLLESEVLAFLPEGTAGFVVWDSNHPAYQKLKTSTWGPTSQQGALDLLKLDGQSTDKTKKTLVALVEVAKKTGLIATEPNQPEAVRQGAFWVAADLESKKPAGGMLLLGAKGVNLKDKLGAIQETLKQEGLTPVKQQLGSIEGFSIAIPASVPDAQNPGEANGAGAQAAAVAKDLTPPEIFVGATQERLALGSSKKFVTDSLDKTSGAGISALRNSAGFKRLMEKSPPADTDYSFGYLGVPELIKTIGAQASDEIKKQGGDPESLPVDALALTRGMRDAPSASLLVSFNPKTAEQQGWLATLDKPASADLIKGIPSSIPLAISIDGAPLSKIKNAALASAGPDAQAAMQAQLAIIDTLKSLALVVVESTAASPFPGVVLVANSSDGTTLKNTIKSQVTALTSSGGMPLSGWQQKQLGTTPIDFIMSPIGVGVFLAGNNDTVVLATSEQGLQKVLDATQKTETALNGQLSNSLKEPITGKSLNAVAYVDYSRLSDLIQSAQGNLSMFTGGKTSFDTASLDAMKKLGRSVSSVSYKDQVLKMVASYDAAVPAPKS